MSHAKVPTSGLNLLPGPLLVEVFSLAFDAVVLGRGRRAERRHLLQLDDRMLKDIGLSRDQVRELRRQPFRRA